MMMLVMAAYGAADLIERLAYRLVFANMAPLYCVAMLGKKGDAEFFIRKAAAERKRMPPDRQWVIVDCGLEEEERALAKRLCEELRLNFCERSSFFEFLSIDHLEPERSITNPIRLNTTNAIPFTTTTQDPGGISATCATITPAKKHTTDTVADDITTALKLLNTLIEVSAGKIISAEIRSVPIIRIPRTIVTAVRDAIIILYAPAGIPAAPA